MMPPRNIRRSLLAAAPHGCLRVVAAFDRLGTEEQEYARDWLGSFDFNTWQSMTLEYLDRRAQRQPSRGA